MSIAPKPEWDTPPHGDFAAYVERLSGAVPGAQSAGRLLQASRPATRPNPKAGPGKRTEAVGAVQGKAVAPGPYSVWEPLSRVVRAVRGVLLLSVVVYNGQLAIASVCLVSIITLLIHFPAVSTAMKKRMPVRV